MSVLVFLSNRQRKELNFQSEIGVYLCTIVSNWELNGSLELSTGVDLRRAPWLK